MLMKGLYILLVVVSPVVTEYCPPNNSTGDPHFTKTPAGQDDFTLNTAGKLFCCATGVDSILWERKGQGWELYPWADSDNMELKNRNQTLQIMSFSMQYDTLFMCSLIKDGTVVKKHSMRIYVHSCVSTRGPMLIMPFPEDKTIERLGVTIQQYCTGYFGCDLSDFKIVEWFVKDKNSNGVEDKIRGNDTHYSITTSYSVEEKRSISKVLTIHDVQAIDLHKQFVCRVSSDQLIQKNNIKQVSISLKDTPEYKSYNIGISVGSGVVFILVLMGIVVYKSYGPQIRLHVFSRFALLAPRPITEKEFDYNVFIYVAAGDEKKGQLIGKQLKDYKVFTTTQVEGNQAEVASYGNECEKAAIVFFLYSQNLHEDSVADFIVQGLIKKRKPILCVEIDNFDEKDWIDKAKHRKPTNIKNHKEQDAKVPLLETNAVENDNKVWKNLPRCKLPSEDSSERQKTNFWCSLQNKIPKFEHQ